MPRRPGPDPKVQALRQSGTFNPQAKRVGDPLFGEHDFFDPRDLVQVKYEMVRRVRVEGQSIQQTARAFGFSRPSFYAAQSTLQREGLPGLIPRRRGPRRPRKLTPEVMALIEELLSEDPSLRARGLVKRIESQLGVRLHPRTIERALGQDQKKRR
jgi:transposase